MHALEHEVGNAFVGWAQFGGNEIVLEQVLDRIIAVRSDFDRRAMLEIPGFADQVNSSHEAADLLEQVEQKGVGGSAIQVLEALLRLRQVACHPGLVDPEWEEAGSAKLEVLFEQVAEILDEGHKVLLFSQFTKLLAYVRRELDQRHQPYAYLDGQTRDRAEVVERFQNEPECNLFLISLKAGGLGLNLTSAQYVFILDPWWNPAVEAQAIDRAHRIVARDPR